MKSITLQLSEKEELLIRKYADLHHMEPSTFILEAVLERIEDEHDLVSIDKVLKEDEDRERLTHDQVKSDLGL